MGCDIHLWVEVRDSAVWRFASPYRIEEYEDEQWIEWDAPYKDRNYYLFAILAGVRGRNLPFTPISAPRGVPDDISDIGRRICEEDPGGHSHSWLLASELLDYNWTSLITFQGFVQYLDLQKLEKTGNFPSEWMPHRANNFMWSAQWQESSAACVGSFYADFLPTLNEYGSREQVRIVFFFDN